jgi:predicted ArsR family transcriptional regulator|tara:strand:- start:68 stop:532 length:465 start_codon:yes stop_codon:yes gene_type:complete
MPLDNEGILKTSADDLYELVKNRKKISIEEAAKALKLPLLTVQALIDFLVEEKIFGLEYKFTTPYIYLSKESEKKLQKVPEKSSFVEKLTSKEDFYGRAKQKGIFHERIESLWKKYLNQNLGSLKEEFYRKAKLRNIPDKKIHDLWEKYMSYLI